MVPIKRLAQLHPVINSFYCSCNTVLPQYSTPSEENVLLILGEQCSFVLRWWLPDWCCHIAEHTCVPEGARHNRLCAILWVIGITTLLSDWIMLSVKEWILDYAFCRRTDLIAFVREFSLALVSKIWHKKVNFFAGKTKNHQESENLQWQ